MSWFWGFRLLWIHYILLIVIIIIPILERFAPKPFFNNRGVNPLATAFVVSGFTPMPLHNEESDSQSSKENVSSHWTVHELIRIYLFLFLIVGLALARLPPSTVSARKQARRGNFASKGPTFDRQFQTKIDQFSIMQWHWALRQDWSAKRCKPF